MRKLIILCFSTLLCVQAFAQRERILNNTVGSEAVDGSTPYLNIHKGAMVHMFPGEEKGRVMVFLKAFVSMRFVVNKVLIPEARLYQYADTAYEQIGVSTAQYKGNLMVNLNQIADTMVLMGFYVFVNKKDLDPTYMLENVFTDYVKNEKKKTFSGDWMEIAKTYGFWESDIWHGRYFMQIAYDDFSMDERYRGYRLIVIFDHADSSIVAYGQPKEYETKIKYVSSSKLNRDISLNFIRKLDAKDEEEDKALQNAITTILNDSYIK